MATQDDIMKMIPPNNIEAEQAVLGSMMMKKSAVADAAELLNRSDFYRDAHGIVFETMLKLSNDNVPVDIVTLSEQLDKENLLEKVGGPAFIAGLANAVPSASNVTYYANIVREKADLRNLINAASDITAMAFDGEEDVPTILDKAEKRIMDASSRHMSGDFTPINQIVIESIDKINTVYESRGGLTGIPTEFTDLDKLTFSQIAIRDYLKEEEQTLAEYEKVNSEDGGLPLNLMMRQRMLVKALRLLLESEAELEEDDELEEQEEPSPVQSDLPVMRNNDQRKEWLKNYKDWPVWFEVPEASEIYYRFNLPDGSSIVICEYHMWLSWKEKYSDENPDSIGTREYLLNPGYRYLQDCCTNSTVLVEHLKNLQKGEKK